MEFMASRMDTVCFTGHRPEKLTWDEALVRAALRAGIDRALKWKFSTFITGMAQGVDLWAAEEILSMRKERPELRLVCAIPYESFAEKWNHEWKARYAAVKEAADEVHIVCPRDMRGAPLIRDRWMVDHSGLVIAVYSGEKGGTKATVEYAEKQKIRVINVLKDV